MTTMLAQTSSTKVERTARLRWVAIANMRVSALAQRELNEARVDKLAANFNPEELGTPTVNFRDGFYWIIDGQHRIATLERVGWGDQQIQCWVYEGLTEEEEAEKFLTLGDTLTIRAFDKFRIAVKAGRPDECEIDRIVRAAGLCVSQDAIPGAIAAVGTLTKLYRRSDAKTLARTLRLIRDAYGDAGLDQYVIDGLGLVCARFPDLDPDDTAKRLSKVHGGVNGLLNRAEKLRLSSGNAKNHCVAATAVEILNQSRPAKDRLPAWWKQQ